MKKGIKLDFKRTDILPKSLKIVQNILERINFPLWINADIIKGPSFLGLPRLSMVDANEFLNLTQKYVADATFSPGFTTSGTAHPPEYTLEQMDNMISALTTNNCLNNGHRITFPIRALYAGKLPKNNNNLGTALKIPGEILAMKLGYFCFRFKP